MAASGRTVKYSLPYPVPSDPDAISLDIQSLATAIDTLLPTSINNLLPNTGGTIFDEGGALFNVKAAAYAATGLGIADDTAAINLALTAAGVSGGTVYFPSGTYLISNMLQVPSGVTILGAGKGASTIRMKSGSWSSVAQVGSINGLGALITKGNTTATNITVQNITIDGNQTGVTAIPGWTASNLCSGIHLNNVTGLVLDHVEVINTIGYTVYLQSVVRFRIEHCRILSGQTNVTQGWGAPTVQDGLHIADSSYGVIDGNFIDTGTYTTNVGDDGIALQSYAAVHDIAITNNTIRSGTAGIDLALSGSNIYNITITGNNIWAAQAGGVISQPFTGSGAISYNIVVSGNTITNAVTTANSSKGAICFMDYAAIASPAQGWANVTISGNTITGMGFGYAIYARFGNTIAITGNTITGFTPGIPIRLGDNISGSCPVTDFTITGNSLNLVSSTATTIYAILINDSLNGTISGNVVVGPAGPVASSAGVVLFYVATAVTGVTVTGNRLSILALGVYETATCDYNLIVGNNTHSSTSSVSTSGSHTVSASNL